MIPDPADPTKPVPPAGGVDPYSPFGRTDTANLTLLDIAAAPVPPWFFCILMIPFGAITGYASNTLGALLTRGGLDIGDLAVLGAAGTLPHTFKVFWSPVVDLTLTPKWWYFISAVLTAVGIAILGAWPAVPGSLAPLKVAVFVGWDPLESTCRHASLSIL